MSEVTKVGPAMTPEEWEEHLSGAYGNSLIPEGYACLDKGGVYISYDSGRAGVDINDRHATAALCLEGQPFGFTWEDVDHLRMIADAWSEARGMDKLHQDTARLHRLTNRIEALLPPRESA